MIEKMKFLSIAGPKDDIDRVVEQYLSKYEIHLENALSELKTVASLRPYTETNPYKAELQTAAGLMESYHSHLTQTSSKKLSLKEAVETVHSLDGKLQTLTKHKEELEKEADVIRNSINNVIPFANLNYNLKDILHFKYVKFRFGRMPRDYYNKFMTYIYNTIDTVNHPCMEDADYIWAVYFVPHALCDKIDAIYASMHFERFYLPDEYTGTPEESCASLKSQIASLTKEIEVLDSRIISETESRKTRLLQAYSRLDTFTRNFDIRKMAACTKHEEHTFYILCGWMAEDDAARFQNEIAEDENTFCIVENDHKNLLNGPPTKMKNPKLFKPFEMFIQMYGLPAYNEIDPTILIGITYSFLFGFMFGDVGQGLCLLIGGFLLYRFKKINLAAIISCCGFFSTIFGFMFGSIFGFEDIIEPLWIRPIDHMTTLPFLGKLNTVFIVAVAFGMFLIIVAMILHIINAARSKDIESTWFDPNGVAGLIFYIAVVVTIVLFMTGNPLPGGIVMGIMFGVPLLLIFLKEPLTRMIEKRADKMETGPGMYIVQGFFEMFETLLSYFSNTISFIRIGAFAVSHAAIMEVVLQLAGAESGNPNWFGVIFGNLFVCGFEGLIVGIQVLRLEYYEMFSRFYKGSGRAFDPYTKKKMK